MNEITKKFSKLTKEQSKVLAGQMNNAYTKGGNSKASSNTNKKPPSKKK